jgi:hypothetical protein
VAGITIAVTGNRQPLDGLAHATEFFIAAPESELINRSGLDGGPDLFHSTSEADENLWLACRQRTDSVGLHVDFETGEKKLLAGATVE